MKMNISNKHLIYEQNALLYMTKSSSLKPHCTLKMTVQGLIFS